MSLEKYQIVVIGAGPAGLTIAKGCAKQGKKVLLIEKGSLGGTCAHFGCIPSKALIASGQTAHAMREAIKMGISTESSLIQGDLALARIAHIVSQKRESEEKETTGIKTIQGSASFTSPHHLKIVHASGSSIEVFAERTIIATGSSPHVPQIKGLDKASYETTETIFSHKKIPKRLIIVGAGPAGCELAQAFRRLGAEVFLCHNTPLPLNKESLAARKVVAAQLHKEGVSLHLGFTPLYVEEKKGLIRLELQEVETRKKQIVEGDTLLFCTGRRPNLKALHLERAGIVFDEKGIKTDPYGRTSNRDIWAVGDCTGAPFFTHVAEREAKRVLASLLLPFGIKKKVQGEQPVPRITFTDPEVAAIGLSEKEALALYPKQKLKTYRIDFTEVDRAITATKTEGFIEIITKRWSSEILGATIVGPKAGEMLMQISSAIYFKIPLRKLTKVLFPYPIYSEAIGKAAEQWFPKRLSPFQGLTL